MRTLKALCLSLSVVSAPFAASAEMVLEGARPFYLEPCPVSRKADPFPLPETMARGSDTRPVCDVVVKKVAKKASSEPKRHSKPARSGEIRIYQK